MAGTRQTIAYDPMPSAPSRTVLSWGAFSRRCPKAADVLEAPRDPVLVGYVEHLGGALKNLWGEVQHAEARQGSLDRRLIEFRGQLEHMEQRLARGPDSSQFGPSLRRESSVETIPAMEKEKERPLQLSQRAMEAAADAQRAMARREDGGDSDVVVARRIPHVVSTA